MKYHMPIFQNPDLEGGTVFWKGDPTGVLLIHGFTATTVEVRPLANEFQRMGLTVSAPLLPGHGTTPQEMNRTKCRDWINCVEDAYQQLCLQCQKVIVGVESMGAVLSLYLAEQHPEIDALLLYSPALRVEKLQLARYLKYFIPIMENSNNDPDDTSWQGYTVNPLYAADEFWKLQKQVIAQLALIHQPALILQGIHDKTIHPDCGKMILDRIQSPVNKLIFMQNSGHGILLDQEIEDVVYKTVEFLKGVDIL
jgi:carboxylesterase